MSRYMKYPDNTLSGTLTDIAKEAHSNSVAKGFWTNYYTKNPSVDTALVKLALVTSEIGEAIEAARLDDWESFGEELADICIRVFDLAEGFNIHIQSEIVSKMMYNKGREKMHGKLA